MQFNIPVVHIVKSSELLSKQAEGCHLSHVDCIVFSFKFIMLLKQTLHCVIPGCAGCFGLMYFSYG